MSDQTNAQHGELIGVLIDALREDANLQSVLGTPARVFDTEPSGAAYPYVFLDRYERHDKSSTGVAGAEHRFQFSALLRNETTAMAKQVIGALRVAVQRLTLSLEGHRVILILPTYSDIMRGRDRQQLRGVLRVRIHTEEI